MRDVLQEAVTVATAADEWMGNLATAASRDVVPAAPPVLSSSRRKVNCWFPAIQQNRGPVGHINRVLMWAATDKISRIGPRIAIARARGEWTNTDPHLSLNSGKPGSDSCV